MTEPKPMSNKRTRKYVNHIFKLIKAKPDIKDVLILNSDGNPVETTMNEIESVQYAGMYSSVQQRAKYVISSIDPEDDVLSLRIRTRYHEVVITPDEKITIIVFQDPIDQIQKQLN